MREILFRGKYSKKSPDWIEGSFHRDEDTNICEIAYRYYKKENETKTGIWVYGVVDPETVGQYTGLKDKNGKKIFEGDIIRVEHDLWHGENKKTRESDIGVVIYNTNTAEFGVKIPGYSNCLTLRRWKGDFNEVIGNIHDKKLEDFENGC